MATGLSIALRTNRYLVDQWLEPLCEELEAAGLATEDHGRACVGIIWKESGGRPKLIGDRNLLVGPSVGLGQVSRATAKDLKLWKPPTTGDERRAYATMAEDDRWGIHALVQVYKHKLKVARGDVQLAIERYNGGGPMARAYRTDVVAWLSEAYPSPQLALSLEKP